MPQAWVCGYCKECVGSYGTRNVVGIGMIVIGSDRQILLIYDDDDVDLCSSFSGGIPFSWSIRLALPFRP